jgi:arylsulfatase A-like enzyme
MTLAPSAAPSTRYRSIAMGFIRGGIEGALFGAALTVAEVALGALAGGRLPPRFWLFLALYYVPATAILGAGLASGWAVTHAGAPGRGVALNLVAHCVYFVAAGMTLVQLVLPEQPLSSPLRLAALAATAVVSAGASTLTRRLLDRASRRPGAYLGLLILPLAWLPILHLGSSAPLHLRGAVLLLLPAIVGLVAFWSTLQVLEWGGFWSPLGAAALSVAVVGPVMRGLRSDDRDPTYFHDDPQPRPPVAASTERPRPNIVLIVLDTLRARSLSCYGYSRLTSPNLDAFARRATRYARCTAPAPWTLPSHASLFTGLYPTRHGAHDARLEDPTLDGYSSLGDEFETLAEALSRLGYATASISANSAFMSSIYRLDQGFRYLEAFPAQARLRLAHIPLLERVESRVPLRWLAYPWNDWFPSPYRSAEEITARAESWMLRRPAGQPYLLFVNYMDAHVPYAPRGAFRNRWGDRSRNRRFPVNDVPARSRVEIVTGRRDPTSEEYEHLRALYDGAINYLDYHVGALLRFLEAQPGGADTWVIVTADHGEALGEHHSLTHGATLYDEAIHVPLIVRYPPGVGQGPGVETRPVQLVDILPTILDVVGVPPERRLDGAPLSRPRQQLLAEAFAGEALAGLYSPKRSREGPRREVHALMEGDLKYIETTNAAPQLYDDRTDPFEKGDLAASRPEVVARLRGALQEIVTRLDRPVRRVVMSREQRERLKALGYAR